MRYRDMIEQLSTQTGLPIEVVRDLLFAVPDILISLGEGEQVRTPFGVFRMTQRKARAVTIPTSTETLEVPAEMVVKLRPGIRLRRRLTKSQ